MELLTRNIRLQVFFQPSSALENTKSREKNLQNLKIIAIKTLISYETDSDTGGETGALSMQTKNHTVEKSLSMLLAVSDFSLPSKSNVGTYSLQ